MRRRCVILASLGVLAAFPPPTARSSFRLNEIVPRARDGVGEWVELVNAGSIGADVAGWSLADATGRARRVAVARVVPPGGLVVLAAQPESLRAHHALPETVAVLRPDGWPILNDHDAGSGLPADSIVLARPDGSVADSAAYFEAWLPPEPGRSLERADPAIPAFLAGAWGWSDAAQGSTPGRANSLGAPLGLDDEEPWSGPEEVSPESRPAVFLYRVPSRGRLAVWLVDLDGSEVAVLQEPIDVYGAGRWVWGSGMPLPPRSGAYLVCLRWQGNGSVLKRCRVVWVSR